MSEEPLKAPSGRSIWVRLLTTLAVGGVIITFVLAGLICVLPVALFAIALAFISANYEDPSGRPTPVTRLIGIGLAMFFSVFVGEAYFNLQRLSTLRRPINASGGYVFTSGDGMADIMGPEAVMGVEFRSNKEFDDSKLAEFVPLLNQFPHLQSLNLTGTAVTDAGLKHLRYVRTLRRLLLRETPTTAAGIAELQRAMPRLEIDK